MKRDIQNARGFRDLIENLGDKYSYLIDVAKEEAVKIGCKYTELPIVEDINLFKRGMEYSDVVQKEMFLLEKDDLCLRPEITAPAMRSLIQCGISKYRMMYIGPCFRYERPQKGRYRQFFQFGCEIVGENHCEFDIFMLIDRIMKRLNIKYYLKINNIGTCVDRRNFEVALGKYVKENYDKYSFDSQKRYDDGRLLRILDSKIDIEINKNAPCIKDYVSGNDDFDLLCKFFKTSDISYQIDYNLVRGLDYYNGIVFEIFSDSYDTDSCQNALGGGGRYDDLAACLGSQNIKKSAGFAFGLDRLLECIQYEQSVEYNCVVLSKDYNVNLLAKVYEQYENIMNIGYDNPSKYKYKFCHIIQVTKDDIIVK